MRHRFIRTAAVVIGAALLLGGCANTRVARFLGDLCTQTPFVAQSYIELTNRELDKRLPGARVTLECPLTAIGTASGPAI